MQKNFKLGTFVKCPAWKFQKEKEGLMRISRFQAVETL
jgi:hypothetical protein